MIGKTISHYRIVEKVGGGGMGVVYKAVDLKLERPVALKFLPPDLTRDTEAKQRFVHEAKAASSLQHNNICVVYDIDQTDDGQLFIAMEYLDGETLKSKIENGRLKIEDGVEIAIQVAQGLAKAHEHGIIHRDIKPANIMVTTDGVVKIVDFGLAKLAGRTLLTKRGSTLGTAAYMSPEQAHGEAVDRRTDIWSLGVVLYEMLSGEKPFESDYEQALVYSILNEDPRPVRDLCPDVPETLEHIIRKALAKSPKDRFQWMAEFIEVLQSSEAWGDLSGPRRRFLSKTRRRVYGSIAGCIMLAAVIVVFNVLQPRRDVIHSIAVLPCENLSADSSKEYFYDGMTIALIDELAKVKSLSPIAWQSVKQYKKTNKPISEIAKELGVQAIVSAQVFQEQGNVRISASLVESSEKVRWSGRFDKTMKNILALQSEVAGAIVREINVALTPAETAMLTASRVVDPEVYEVVLKGKAILEYATSEKECRQAIGLFQQALARDSSYAPAWAGLGGALWMLAATGFEFVAPAEVRDMAITAAEKALEIDGTLADAHEARATIAWDGEWDVEKAQRHFERALELQPGYAVAHNAYAQMLSGLPLARFDEAREHLRRACEIDPLSPWNDINIIAWWIFQGRPERALEEGKLAHQRNPALPVVCWQMGLAQLVLGRPHQAVPEFEAALKLSYPSRPASFIAPLGLAYGLAGRRMEAVMILREMDSTALRGYISPYYLAAVYSALGRMERAFQFLDEALEHRTPWLVNSTPIDPLSIALRRDPRWKVFVEKLRQRVRLPAGTPNPYL